MHRSGREAGITLIELMVVVAIVAILAAIAYPSYQAFVRQTGRTDATRTMAQYAQMLQRCYSQYFTYINSATTPCTVVAGTTASSQGYYNITVAIADPQNYTITAVPGGPPQSADTPCWTFTLSSTGQQTAQDKSGNPNTQTCWGSN
jgi:type IV pilus assembly protein PilE